jgi:tetratricopeptide (TPR) repeat protein
MDLFVDGLSAGTTVAKTFTLVPVRPGSHKLVSKAENDSELPILAQAGQNIFVWQEVKMGLLYARNKLQLVSPQQGESGVLECNLIAASPPPLQPLPATPAQPLVRRPAPSTAPTQQATDAPLHESNAKQLFEREQFAEAASEFEMAFRASNDPSFLYNAAMCYRRAGNAEAALGAYENYLREAPDSPQRATVEARINELKRQLNAESARAQGRSTATNTPPPRSSSQTPPQSTPPSAVHYEPLPAQNQVAEITASDAPDTHAKASATHLGLGYKIGNGLGFAGADIILSPAPHLVFDLQANVFSAATDSGTAQGYGLAPAVQAYFNDPGVSTPYVGAGFVYAALSLNNIRASASGAFFNAGYEWKWNWGMGILLGAGVCYLGSIEATDGYNTISQSGGAHFNVESSLRFMFL